MSPHTSMSSSAPDPIQRKEERRRQVIGFKTSFVILNLFIFSCLGLMFSTLIIEFIFMIIRG
jgi:hypothetical protein